MGGMPHQGKGYALPLPHEKVSNGRTLLSTHAHRGGETDGVRPGNGVDPSRLALHPWLIIPGFFIVATVVAFNFLGDGVRDAFDAKSRA